MRRKKVAVVVATAVVALFFLAPFLYWFSEPSGIVYYEGHDTSLYVYRSLGCATVGVGTSYYPADGPQGNYSGLHFGCEKVLPRFPVG